MFDVAILGNRRKYEFGQGIVLGNLSILGVFGYSPIRQRVLLLLVLCTIRASMLTEVSHENSAHSHDSGFLSGVLYRNPPACISLRTLQSR